MKRIFRVIDSVNEFVGKNSYWLPAALMVIVIIDVVGRYFFRYQTVWGFETCMMLGGLIMILPWGWNELHKRNIRVDVVYIHLSLRKQKIIDVIGNSLTTLPVLIILIPPSFTFMMKAWKIHEVMDQTIWYPPAAPFRMLVFIAILLALVQYIVTLIRDIRALKDKEDACGQS